MNAKATHSSTADREIVMSRVLDAPRELVFKAYTEPEHIARWWGPNGFSTTIHEMDVRPGGMWRFMMHGPNGIDYPNRIVYTEVVPPERLVFDHGGDSDEHFPQFHVTVIFDDVEGNTELTLRMLFPTVEECQKTRDFGAVEGGNQTLTRLEEYLKTMSA